MTSTPTSNSTDTSGGHRRTGRQESPLAFKTSLGPMEHALVTTENKSELSLLMDVTKEEKNITKVVVQRDKTGKLRYSISKQSTSQIDGVVDASPSACNRLRQDSLVKDYIPELLSSSKRLKKNKPSSRSTNASEELSTTPSADERDKAKPKNIKSSKAYKKKKEKRQNRNRNKLLEKNREQSQDRSNKNKYSAGNGKTRSRVIGSSRASIVSDDAITPIGTVVSASSIKLPQAHHSEIHSAPRQVNYETVNVFKASPTKSNQLEKFVSPTESLSDLNKDNSQLTFVTPPQDCKSPPASPTSKIFCIPPNWQKIRTPSPPGKRAQTKASSLTEHSLSTRHLLVKSDDKKSTSEFIEQIKSTYTWKSLKSNLSIPKSKVLIPTANKTISPMAPHLQEQPLGRLFKGLGGKLSEQEDASDVPKSEPKSFGTPVPNESTSKQKTLLSDVPADVMSSKEPYKKTGQSEPTEQSKDSELIFFTPVPGQYKTPPASPTSKIFALPPNVDKIKTPSPTCNEQKANKSLSSGVVLSGTPKTQHPVQITTTSGANNEKRLSSKEMTPKEEFANEETVKAPNGDIVEKPNMSGTPSKVQQIIQAIESLKVKLKSQPQDQKQLLTTPTQKDRSEDGMIIPVQSQNSKKPKEKDIEGQSVATISETIEKQVPNQDRQADTAKPSRETPNLAIKPNLGVENPKDIVKVQSSMTTLNQSPESVGVPFENVLVQPSDEKMARKDSNIPLERSIGLQTEQSTVKLESYLEAPRMHDEPDAVQVKPIAKQLPLLTSSQLDAHLKFYYHQEASLRSIQACYSNEVNKVEPNEQKVAIKTEEELIAQQESLMQQGDAFLDQLKKAPPKASANCNGNRVSAAYPTGHVFGDNQATQAQPISTKAKVLMAMAAVVGLCIAAKLVNILI